MSLVIKLIILALYSGIFEALTRILKVKERYDVTYWENTLSVFQTVSAFSWSNYIKVLLKLFLNPLPFYKNIMIFEPHMDCPNSC